MQEKGASSGVYRATQRFGKLLDVENNFDQRRTVSHVFHSHKLVKEISRTDLAFFPQETECTICERRKAGTRIRPQKSALHS